MTTEQSASEKDTLVAECTQHLRSIGVPENNIETWLQYKQSTKVQTWRKIKNNLPTKEEMEHWASQPHDLEALNRIKSPLLAGWTVQEIIEAMGPFILSNVKRYRSHRSELDDNMQDGAIGVIKALKTDAGISPFGNHAYLHTRTNIRRPAVGSGLIAKTERKPGRTEVLSSITTWLCGLGIEEEMEKLLEKDHYQYEYFGQTVKPTENSTLSQLVKEAEKEGFVFLATRLWRINSKDEKKYRSLAKKSNITNGTPFLLKEQLQLFPLQRTGVRGAKAFLVSYSYQLSQLSLVILNDLRDWLNTRYNHTQDLPTFWKESAPDILSEDRYETVADLVGAISCSPDFTGNPIPLDISVKGDDFSLASTIPDQQVKNPLDALSEKESTQRINTLVRMARSKLNLTIEQKTVLVFLYGLDGEERVAGSVLANNFGKFILRMAEKDGVKLPHVATEARVVSRQRIMQYDMTIQAKLAEAIFQILVATGEAEVVKARIEVLSERADLTAEEAIALSNHNNLESTVELITVPNLSKQERLVLLRESLTDAKYKVIRFLLQTGF